MADHVPPENLAVIYAAADPKMLLRIIDGDLGPGLVSLETLRQISAAIEADLADRIQALESGSAKTTALNAETQARIMAMQALSKAISDEVTARAAAVAVEAKARGDADAAEATARSNADAAEATVRASAVAAETAARTSALSALAARVKALEDKPALRIERYTATTNASGIAAFTFPAFTTVPDVDVIEGWNGEQMITGALAAAPTKTGCSAQIMVSRGTLLLTSGPFTKAGAGVSVTIRAIGT